MIKFFRKIRKSLLSNGKTTQYLLYAIGEILLVIIGILIALQINNWNEYRKISHTEIKLLQELKSDLQDTKIDLMSDIETCHNNMATSDSIYKILKGIKEMEPIIISREYVTRTPLLFPKLSAYQAIQEKGVSIISNDALRKKITDFFQLHLARVQRVESIHSNYSTDELRPFLTKHSAPFTSAEDDASLYEIFKTERFIMDGFYVNEKSDEFVHIIKFKFDIIQAILVRYEQLNSYLEELIQSITIEISERDG